MLARRAAVLGWGMFLIVAGGSCSTSDGTRDESQGSAPPDRAIEVEADLPSPRDRTGPPAEAVSTLIRDALQSDGSLSYRVLLGRLGTPQRVETEAVANDYVANQVDTLRTLIYNDVEALIYDVSHRPKSFLVRLTLVGERYATPEGLSVGLSEQEVLDKLGIPTRREAGGKALVYEETDPTPIAMIIQLEGGQVDRITWEFPFT